MTRAVTWPSQMWSCVWETSRTYTPSLQALRGVESVLLVSAIDPRQVELQGNLVATARRSGVAHIVKLSGLATAPDSTVRSGRWSTRSRT